MIESIFYSAKEIEKAVSGRLEGDNVNISSITTSSKEKTDKGCFFAIKGEKFNGADYVKEAISNGAVLVVAQEKIAEDVSVIYVENVACALGLLAKHHKGSTRVIGITGSVGKTTTKEIIISVLKEKYSVCGTRENENNEIGVALTLLSIKNEDFCVVEMGMRGLGEIKWLSYIAEPYIAVITNCGTAHLGRLGSRDNIFKAKTEIFEYTDGFALMPSDDRFKALKIPQKTVFVGENGDICAKNITQKDNKINFDIVCEAGVYEGFEIKTVAQHDVNNASYAFAVCRIIGVDVEAIKKGLSKFENVGLRQRLEYVENIEVLVDCYNASYESMVSAVVSAVEYAKSKNKRCAVVLGDMQELGENDADFHREIGRICKSCGVSKLYSAGENAEMYLYGFEGGIMAKCKEDLARIILKELNEEYVLLVKASRKCQFEKIVEFMRARE